jgi:hypothetical protein
MSSRIFITYVRALLPAHSIKFSIHFMEDHVEDLEEKFTAKKIIVRLKGIVR